MSEQELWLKAYFVVLEKTSQLCLSMTPDECAMYSARAADTSLRLARARSLNLSGYTSIPQADAEDAEES